MQAISIFFYINLHCLRSTLNTGTLLYTSIDFMNVYSYLKLVHELFFYLYFYINNQGCFAHYFDYAQDIKYIFYCMLIFVTYMQFVQHERLSFWGYLKIFSDKIYIIRMSFSSFIPNVGCKASPPKCVGCIYSILYI